MLEDHRLKWVKLRAQLDAWMAGLQEGWKLLQGERERLGETEVQWEVTREVAASQDFSAELLQRIDAILERLRAVEAISRERSNDLASVIDRVSRGQEVAAEALETVDAMAAVVRERWLDRDEPPLWELAPLEHSSSLFGEAREAYLYWTASVAEAIRERPERFLLSAAVFFLALTLAQLVRRRSQSWPTDDAEIAAARFVVSRPAAAALAFTLVTLVYIVGEVPGSVRDLVGVLGILAVVPLGVGLLPAPAHPALYGTVTLYVLNRLWALAPDGSLLRRLLLLFVIAGALAGALLLLRYWRSRGISKRSRWWRLSTAAIYLSATFLSVSLLAALGGWSTLAQLLTSATIDSAFSAVAWSVVAIAMAGLLRLPPRSAIGRTFTSISRHEPAFRQAGLLVVIALAATRWADTVLHNFQVYEPIRQAWEGVMATALARGTLDVRVGDVLVALLVLVVTYFISRIMPFVLKEEVLPRAGFTSSAAHSIVTLVNYVIIAFGVVLAASTIGFSGTQLTVVFGALGVGIGFGLQTVVANFVSGLILIFERPVKVGDTVRTANHFGVITDIGIRASTIRSFDGADVVVPNGDLVSKEVINWTRSDRMRRVEATVKLSLVTDPKKVLERLNKVAADHPLVADPPPPSSFMTGIGDGSLDFRLFAWTRVENFLTVSSDLNVAIHEAIREMGFEIAVPRREVRISSGEGATNLDPPQD